MVNVYGLKVNVVKQLVYLSTRQLVHLSTRFFVTLKELLVYLSTRYKSRFDNK